jgi:NAD(P)-dependent dehydrogenase (short-subunit alcohol dehydrogenase family)
MTSPKIALVTGTSSGLGRAIAQSLALHGCHVFATMRGIHAKNATAAAELTRWATSEGVNLQVVELDVTDAASIEAAVQIVADTVGRIDVLVNNAGRGIFGLVETFTAEQVQSLFETNVFGPLKLTQAVLPYMRRQQNGLLIHMSSIAGSIPYPYMGTYGGAKAAFEGIALTINSEVYSLGIDTVIVQAGGYGTDFASNVEMTARQDIWDSYGSIGEAGKAMIAGMPAQFASGYLSTPESLAEKLAEIVDLPSGQRPLKLAIGLGSEGFDVLNNILLPLQTKSLEANGFGELVKRSVIEEAVS